MRGQAEERLQELRAEYEKGQKMLADLRVREAELEQTLLRISGAIQVLEEMLARDEAAAEAAPGGNGASGPKEG